MALWNYKPYSESQLREHVERRLSALPRAPLGPLVVGLILAVAGAVFINSVFDPLLRPAAVPSDHFVIKDGGQYYVVGKGNDPLATRPRTPLDASQVRLWQEYKQRRSHLRGLSLPLAIAGVTTVAWLRWRRKAERAPPDFK